MKLTTDDYKGIAMILFILVSGLVATWYLIKYLLEYLHRM